LNRKADLVNGIRERPMVRLCSSSSESESELESELELELELELVLELVPDFGSSWVRLVTPSEAACLILASLVRHGLQIRDPSDDSDHVALAFLARETLQLRHAFTVS
jgi:hypothetical protein